MATPNDENVRQFMIYAPAEMVQAIKISAVRREMSTSALVRTILERWLVAEAAEQEK